MWWNKDSHFPAKVTINPSYEWDEDVKELNISHRELEVFALLMDGHENKEVAQILGIQYQTVKNHLSSLYRKLKAKNMAEATKLLLFGNLIQVEWQYSEKMRSFVDRDKWIEDIKWRLDKFNYRITDSEKRKVKNFLIEHGIYGKLYDDRLKELRGEDE